jgi:hypothetical protein
MKQMIASVSPSVAALALRILIPWAAIRAIEGCQT